MYIDFVGKKLHWVDPHTAELHEVEVCSVSKVLVSIGSTLVSIGSTLVSIGSTLVSTQGGSDLPERQYLTTQQGGQYFRNRGLDQNRMGGQIKTEYALGNRAFSKSLICGSIIMLGCRPIYIAKSLDY